LRGEGIPYSPFSAARKSSLDLSIAALLAAVSTTVRK
jgi:hypothetical protein